MCLCVNLRVKYVNVEKFVRCSRFVMIWLCLVVFCVCVSVLVMLSFGVCGCVMLLCFMLLY